MHVYALRVEHNLSLRWGGKVRGVSSSLTKRLKTSVQPSVCGDPPQDPESARVPAHPGPQGVYDPIKIKGCGLKPLRVCKHKMVRAGRDLKDEQDPGD